MCYDAKQKEWHVVENIYTAACYHVILQIQPYLQLVVVQIRFQYLLLDINNKKLSAKNKM